MSNGVMYGRRAGDRKPRILYVPQSAASDEGLPDLIAKFPAELVTAKCLSEGLAALSRQDVDLLLSDGAPDDQGRLPLPSELAKAAQAIRVPILVASVPVDPSALLQMRRLGVVDVILKPCHAREVLLRIRAALTGQRRIACLGGGTGLFTLLSGLKDLRRTLLMSIVSMSDDGGSSGQLRSELGILPPGDVRRSLVALSNAPELMNDLVQFRFQEGGALEQHNLGNLVLAALTRLKGSMQEAVRALGDIMDIHGIVLPSSSTLTDLVARTSSGALIRGESLITRGAELGPGEWIETLWHEPDPVPNLETSAAILFADAVILGPGDLFTSVIANLCIPNIREAIAATPAKTIYVCNLMTQPGETPTFSVEDHVTELIKHLGGDHLDCLIVSNTALSRHALDAYARQGQRPVSLRGARDLHAITGAHIVTADVGHETELVRHNSRKLAGVIEQILSSSAPR